MKALPPTNQKITKVKIFADGRSDYYGAPAISGALMTVLSHEWNSVKQGWSNDIYSLMVVQKSSDIVQIEMSRYDVERWYKGQIIIWSSLT
jgi:hypothetical protein